MYQLPDRNCVAPPPPGPLQTETSTSLCLLPLTRPGCNLAGGQKLSLAWKYRGCGGLKSGESSSRAESSQAEQRGTSCLLDFCLELTVRATENRGSMKTFRMQLPCPGNWSCVWQSSTHSPLCRNWNFELEVRVVSFDLELESRHPSQHVRCERRCRGLTQ